MAAYSSAPNARHSKIEAVYRNVVAINPTDNSAIGPFEAFTVGVSGNVALVPVGSTVAVTIYAIAGFWYPVEFQGINNTGTAATGIVGYG